VATRLVEIKVLVEADPGEVERLEHASQVDGVAEIVARDLLLHGVTDQREAVEWVAAAWKLAGGDRLHLPAYVAPHDFWQSVDVRTGRWVEDSSIYTSAP
jgi:hypothetical protein